MSSRSRQAFRHRFSLSHCELSSRSQRSPSYIHTYVYVFVSTGSGRHLQHMATIARRELHTKFSIFAASVASAASAESTERPDPLAEDSIRRPQIWLWLTCKRQAHFHLVSFAALCIANHNSV